jgi:aminoglycoside N3'-acetyltransferase
MDRKRQTITSDPITREQLTVDFKRLGIKQGDTLDVMVSLKSIGKIVGGAKTFIDALLDVVGPDGTLVTNSYVHVYPLPLSKEDAGKISDRWTPSYAGAVANAMIHYPGACRSRHPIQKFAAVGKRAKELIENHGPDSFAYDVLRVLAESDGKLLKVGPDDQVQGVATTHTAIWKLGLRQNRPRAGINYRNDKGTLVTFERDWPGVCADTYLKFTSLCRDAGTFICEGRVGHADGQITDMGKTLNLQIELLSEDPTILLCDDPICQYCRLGWEFANGSAVGVWFHRGILYLRRQIGVSWDRRLL